MAWPRRLVLTGLLVLLAARSGRAQSNPADMPGIEVHVTDPAGRPLAAAGTLSGPAGGAPGASGGQLRRVRVAPDGELRLAGLPPGVYTLSLAGAGFAPRTITFELEAGQPLHRDLMLTPRGPLTTIEVMASTPISPLDTPVEDVPVPVQTLGAKTITDTGAIDLTDALKRRLNGVYVNENQNNPFQPDLNYRGYTASPLVGSPAGLSVYLDGVRQNQPFGDVVAWDLIPKVAIRSVELIPGSNPVYGLNTLGGAIAVQTKSGASDPGIRVSGYGGSFGRRAVDAEYGGSSPGGLDWYLAGTVFAEDGWRVASPSYVRQSFAALGYARGPSYFTLTAGYAINDLTGNGTQDIRAIRRRVGLNHGYDSVYSIPDRTWQHSPFLTVNATRALSAPLTLHANAYLRYVRTNTTNGDVNDNSFDQSLYTLTAADQAALTAAGIAFPPVITPANTPFPYLRCIAQGLELDEPGSACTGVDTDTVDRQHAYGISALLSWRTARNQLSVGAAWDHGSLTFVQNAQYGYLNPDGRSVTRIPVFLDGSTAVDGDPQDNRVNLHGQTNTGGVYFTDTATLGRWVLTASGRYNHTRIRNQDRLPPVDYRGTLTSSQPFARFLPSAGVLYKATPQLRLYFDYGEGSRAPTSTELGCADPNFPCSLPNALVSDPALKQVVSRTYEAGVRGTPARALRWQAGFFHASNYDDLLFIASQQTGYGYFRNAGQTRRVGVEAAISAHTEVLEAGADYTYLNATYRSSEQIGSGSNSSNTNALAGGPGIDDGGNITIRPGDGMPETPANQLKLYADSRQGSRLSLHADLELVGASYVRGNENNQHRPDGVYYLGPGKSPAYGVVNLGARFRLTGHFELFAQIDNLLNRHYYTGGQLAATPYDDAGNFTPRPFGAVEFEGSTAYPVRNSTYLAPGASVTVFGGLRFRLGGQTPQPPGDAPRPGRGAVR